VGESENRITFAQMNSSKESHDLESGANGSSLGLNGSINAIKKSKTTA